MISKNNKAIVEANNKGYLVIDEKVFYKDKEVKINIKKNRILWIFYKIKKW